MGKVTNTGRTSRGINVRGSGDSHIGVTVMPGQTVDAELFDPGNRVYHGWQAEGLMDFGDALIDPAKAEQYHQAKGDNLPPVKAVAAPLQPFNDADIEAEVQKRLAERQAAADAAAAEAAKNKK